ncbi:hypothetical protein [Streptacidiphilus neutrinimicus]|uniref:hypothetical protein n=1 Tax=Streptacidiphilus neutrinimicus TaxID=105420 RepID=UPI00126A6067|nr:hypothetical protein [Streptacidiphilus neutrinimicus]
MGAGRRTSRLKQRFGPEYTAAMTAHQGSKRNTERALLERERRLDAHPVQPPDPARAEQLARQWHDLQARFVDDPAAVLTEASAELEALLKDMGFPSDPEDRRTVLRFHSEDVLRCYEKAQGIAERAVDGMPSTEELREGFVNAKSVCESLIGANGVSSPDDQPARLASGRAR